jgi:acylphosphatase
MKTFKRTIEVPRYEAKKSEMYDTSFSDALSQVSYLVKGEHYEIFFNTENTGTHYSGKIMEAEDFEFSDITDIKNKMKELNYNCFGVISLFRENGWDGVSVNMTDDALTKKCSNWVENNRNGFIYVVFANKEEDIQEFRSKFQNYINEGFWVYEVYDNEEEDYIDSFYYGNNDEEFKKWQKEMVEKYGFEESDFDNL